jgi:hypothetical protein
VRNDFSEVRFNFSVIILFLIMVLFNFSVVIYFIIIQLSCFVYQIIYFSAIKTFVRIVMNV